MTVWFTADLHLGHARVAGLRGYLDTEQHDRALAEAWDEQVRPRDQVWVLGDVALGALGLALDWLQDRPGAKHLIAGNHDKCHPMHRDSHKWQRWYCDDTFESVQAFARRRVAGQSVLLSHFPYGPKVMNATWVRGEWRATDYEGYMVSSDGEVRGRRGRILKPYVMPSGYLQVTVNARPGGRLTKVSIHRLVAIAFHGRPADPVLQVAHNDGNPANNRAANLRWATPSENAADRILHGTVVRNSQPGEANASAILTAAKVVEIRASARSLSTLAAEYGVSKSTIADIKHDRSWVRRPSADHTDEPRFLQYRLPDMGEWLLHGHTHGTERLHDGRQIHVGLDAWFHRLVPLDTIEELIRNADADAG